MSDSCRNLRPTTTTDLRLVAYVRRSDSSSSLSAALQLAAIRDWATENAHSIVAEVVDVASGVASRSEGVRDALEMVELHNADAVAVHQFSRFGRSSLDFAVNLGRLENLRADLISCTELIDPVINSSWSIDMLAVLASFEDARLAEAGEIGFAG